MRHALWCSSSQTSIPGMRRGWPSSHVTWTRLTVPKHWLLPHPVTLSGLLSSASCLIEAEPCAPHSSASWVSVSPERHGWRGLWWKLGGLHTTDQVPCMRVRRVWGYWTSHLWRAFPSRILCESENLGSCGWVLPIAYFSVEQSSWGWCRWHWGLGWGPCQYSESRVPCGSQILLLALRLIFTLPRG